MTAEVTVKTNPVFDEPNDLFLKFSEKGKIGKDLSWLYNFFLSEYKRQNNHKIYCKDVYIKENITISNKILKECKSILYKEGFISYERRRSSGGLYNKTYIVLKRVKPIYKNKIKEVVEKAKEDKTNITEFVQPVEVVENLNGRVKNDTCGNEQHTNIYKQTDLEKREVSLKNNLTVAYRSLNDLYEERYNTHMDKIGNWKDFKPIVFNNQLNDILEAFKLYLKDKSPGLKIRKHHPNIFVKQFESYFDPVRSKKLRDLNAKFRIEEEIKHNKEQEKILADSLNPDIVVKNQSILDNWFAERGLKSHNNKHE